jgi:hypothetical protein
MIQLYNLIIMIGPPTLKAAQWANLQSTVAVDPPEQRQQNTKLGSVPTQAKKTTRSSHSKRSKGTQG